MNLIVTRSLLMPTLHRHSRGREIDQLRRADDKPEVFPQGRFCMCGTELSRYNAGPQCFAHTPQPKFLETVEELKTLMEAA